MKRTLEDADRTNQSPSRSGMSPEIQTDLLIEPTESEGGDGDERVEPSGDIDDRSENVPATDELPAQMRTHSDRWYVPDSQQYDFALRTPDNDREYRSTPDTVAALLRKYYRD